MADNDLPKIIFWDEALTVKAQGVGFLIREGVRAWAVKNPQPHNLAGHSDPIPLDPLLLEESPSSTPDVPLYLYRGPVGAYRR